MSLYSPMERWERIGVGRYATVFRATAVQGNVPVAIKQMKGKLQPHSHEEAAFRNEFDILLKVEHPNIVKIYHCFLKDNRGYIVMQDCAGESVETKIADGFYDDNEDEVRRVIFSTVKALNYLHSINIYHRDVKPANIMYLNDSEDSPVLLGDFGMSKVVCEGMTATRVGTKGFQAPEILMGHVYTEKCDVWSVGVVAYNMLTSEKPFASEMKEADVRAKMMAHDYNTRLIPSEEAKMFIYRCLQPTEDQRPTTAQLLEDPWFAGLT